MGDYAKLLVWQKAHKLTLEIYRRTSSFPASERFGLTNQLRRSATSVGANIAEGCGRNADGEFTYFVRVSLGSANEVEYHLLLARDLRILDPAGWQALREQTGELKRMLAKLLLKLRNSRKTTPPS